MLAAGWGCTQRSSAPERFANPGSRNSGPSAATAGEPAALAELGRRRTGQATPSVTLTNRHVVLQHAFVDGVHAGELPPGASRTFDVTAGVHTIGCADSRSADDRAVNVTETFEPGYAYHYDVVTR